MPVARCPHCNAPMLDTEAAAGVCPACDRPLAAVVPPASPTLPPESAPHRSPALRRLAWAGLAVVLLAGVGGVVYFTRPGGPAPEPPPADGPTTPVVANAVPDEPQRPEPGPPPRLVQGPETLPVPKIVQVAAVPPEALPAPRLQPEPDPLPKAVAEVLAGPVRTLNRPDGEYVLEPLNGGANVTLRGKVRKLTVPLVDAGSRLDASGLEAKEIVFENKIDAGSRVRLNAPGGRVELRGKVDAGSRLEVMAPGGVVRFTEPSVGNEPGSKIDGNSEVRITARDVTFRGIINGGSRVWVTLTGSGAIRFDALDGGVRLRYKKESPDDPEPKVEPGVVRRGARFGPGE